MATKITSFKPQNEMQSCTALAIKITLHELGISTYSGVAGGEISLWNQLRRSSTPGQQEILPHAAIQYLQSRGCTVEMIEDKIRTAPLSLRAKSDYQEYTTGLSTSGIAVQYRALDPVNDFLNDARVFMIVGFLGKPVPSAPMKLLTHTVLCRLHLGMYWVLNPDGATDKAYSLGQLQTFLANANPMAPVKPEFASKTIYTFTGICYRVTYGKGAPPAQTAEPSVWAAGEANPPYDRLMKAKVVYRGQGEQLFRRELETTAIGATRKSGVKNLRVLIFGPRGELDDIIRWTETGITSLNRAGYQFRISRVLFDHGTKEVRFYDHLRA